mgnify:CR=1 FL=1
MHIENAFSLGSPDTYKNLVVVTSCSYTANCCELSVPLSTENQDMYIDVNIVRIVSLNLNNVEANINIFGAFLQCVFAGFDGKGCLYTLAKRYIHLVFSYLAPSIFII